MFAIVNLKERLHGYTDPNFGCVYWFVVIDKWVKEEEHMNNNNNNNIAKTRVRYNHVVNQHT